MDEPLWIRLPHSILMWIVADISMPSSTAIEAARQIKKPTKISKLFFLTMHPDATYAANASRLALRFRLETLAHPN